MQTVRHFFSDFNAWLDRLPDTRVQDACIYDRRFLAWWGLHLYLLQLGSRRQLDFELRDAGPWVLDNLNRLAQTKQTTLPVHDTLDHFVSHVPRAGWEQLRRRCVQRLLRMKALDAARLLGQPVLRPFWKLFGSLKNVARRLLDSVRYVVWEACWSDPRQAEALRIELDSSKARGQRIFSG